MKKSRRFMVTLIVIYFFPALLGGCGCPDGLLIIDFDKLTCEGDCKRIDDVFVVSGPFRLMANYKEKEIAYWPLINLGSDAYASGQCTPPYANSIIGSSIGASFNQQFAYKQKLIVSGQDILTNDLLGITLTNYSSSDPQDSRISFPPYFKIEFDSAFMNQAEFYSDSVYTLRISCQTSDNKNLEKDVKLRFDLN